MGGNTESDYLLFIDGKAISKDEFNVEAEKDNSLDFKWLDLEEKDERTIAEILDDIA